MTATATPRLYAVPNPPEPHRLGWLLRLRAAARRAYNLALSLPRGAVHWAMSTLSRCGRIVATTAPSLAATLTRIGDTAARIGVLPVLAAAGATPWVTRPLIQAARRLGAALRGPLSRIAGWLASGLRAVDPAGTMVLDVLARLRDRVSRSLTWAMTRLHSAPIGGHLHTVGVGTRAATYGWLTRRVTIALTINPWAGVMLPLLVVALTAVLVTGETASAPTPAPRTPASTGRVRVAPSSPAPDPETAPADQQEEQGMNDLVDTPVPTALNRAARRASQQTQARARRR